MPGAQQATEPSPTPTPSSNGSPHGGGTAETNGAPPLGGAIASPPQVPDAPPAEWRLEHQPGPDSWDGLPPGPRMPHPLQLIGFWHRRGPFLERCRARYGSPFTLHLRVPPVPWVVICEPEQIKRVFLAPADVLWAGDGSSDLHKYFGSPGLAYFEEDRHLTTRKLINRSAHGEAMKQIAASIQDVIEREFATWPRGKEIELFTRFRRLAIQVVRHVSFGPEPDERLDELVDILENDLYPTGENPISMIEDQYLPGWALTAMKAHPVYRRILKHRARADRIVYELIDERRGAGPGDRLDTLSVMLSATGPDGSPLSSVQIRNDITTNLLAGSATTGAAMAWGVERLARQPDTRARLVTEIDAGEDAYLTATVREILRWKPPLPQIIPRLVREPFELGGYVLPPGVRILASAHLVHHDPGIYPEPYAFRPERFLEQSPGNYTWIPFGGGRRRCLGAGIAEHEIKAVLRAFFERFDVRADRPQAERDSSLIAVIKPSRGTRAVLSDRA